MPEARAHAWPSWRRSNSSRSPNSSAAAWPASSARTTATIRRWSRSGKIPATLSRKIVTGLLREKLGYQGVIMSDSLTMRPIKDNYGIEEAAIVTAGRRPRPDPAGLQLRPEDHHRRPGPGRAQGRIPLAQVEHSVRRVWKLKRELGLFEQPPGRPGQSRASSSPRPSIGRSPGASRGKASPCWKTAGCRCGAGGRLLVVSNGSTATVEQDLAWKHSPTNHRLNEEVRRRDGRAESSSSPRR